MRRNFNKTRYFYTHTQVTGELNLSSDHRTNGQFLLFFIIQTFNQTEPKHQNDFG